MTVEYYTTPFLFNVFCAVLGGACLFSPFLWLFRLYRFADVFSLRFIVVSHCLFVIFGMTLFSFGYGVYSGRFLWPEFVLLLVMSIYGVVLKHREGQSIVMAFAKLTRACLFANFCILICLKLCGGFILLLMFGFDTMNAMIGRAVFDPVFDGVFVGGLVLIGAFVALFLQLRQRADMLADFRLYKLLWPVALGLLFFMIPLLIQHVVNSEEFKARKDRPIVLERL